MSSDLGVDAEALREEVRSKYREVAANPHGHMMQRAMPNGEGMKPGMMDPEMHQKMSRMMNNCDRMMESMTPNKDRAGPSVPNKS